jgi:hypothetical protein
MRPMLSGLLPTKIEKRSCARDGLLKMQTAQIAAMSHGRMTFRFVVKNINLQQISGLGGRPWGA